MSTDPKNSNRQDNSERQERPGAAGPIMEAGDWDALEGDALAPTSIQENGDIRYQEDAANEPLGETDNSYQDSDDALPDDEEEAAIARHPSREGSRFDEI